MSKRGSRFQEVYDKNYILNRAQKLSYMRSNCKKLSNRLYQLLRNKQDKASAIIIKEIKILYKYINS